MVLEQIYLPAYIEPKTVYGGHDAASTYRSEEQRLDLVCGMVGLYLALIFYFCSIDSIKKNQIMTSSCKA